MLAWCSCSSDFCSDMPSKRCSNRCRTHSPANDVCSIDMCRAEGILGISASMTAFHSCHIVYMCIERYLLTARRYRQGKLYTPWLTHRHTHSLVNTRTHTHALVNTQTHTRLETASQLWIFTMSLATAFIQKMPRIAHS